MVKWTWQGTIIYRYYIKQWRREGESEIPGEPEKPKNIYGYPKWDRNVGDEKWGLSSEPERPPKADDEMYCKPNK